MLSQESDRQQEESAEIDRETATVRDSVLLSCETPGTSVECAVTPVLAENEFKESQSGLCHHNSTEKRLYLMYT